MIILYTAPGSSRTSWSGSFRWDCTFHSYLWGTCRNTFLKSRLTALTTDLHDAPQLLSFLVSVLHLKRSLIIKLIDATHFASNPSDFALGAGTEY